MTQASQSQTQTQSLTQAEKSLAKLSVDEKKSKVNELVRYLLIMDQKKYPIKRQDINKHVLKEHSRGFVSLMESAKTDLEQFGVKLVELDSKQKSYILVNLIDNDAESAHQVWREDDSCRMALVMVVLSIIFMKGGSVQDTLLYHTLKKMGVDMDTQHEQFGDVKKLMTQEFVRQAYLEHNRRPGTDPPMYDYFWGQRAKNELTRRNVLGFVCQIYGDVTPEQWTVQWNEVLNTEGPPDTPAATDENMDTTDLLVVFHSKAK